MTNNGARRAETIVRIEEEIMEPSLIEEKRRRPSLAFM
jgi:hypothetical protein